MPNRRRAVPALVIICFSAAAQPVCAFDGPRLRLEGGLGYACLSNEENRQHGVAGLLDTVLTFDLTWGARLGYGYALHDDGDGPGAVHQLTAAARYQLDVLEFVPWIELGPALFVIDERLWPQASVGGMLAAVGLDWLLDPSWSVSVAARYYQLFGEERFPAYLLLGFSLGYRWSLGDPLSR